MVQITCKGNSAICTRAERLTSGMVGLQCKFEFDSAWDGLAKMAVFTAGNEKRDVLLTGDTCTVPWEVLKTAGYQLVIGVYGTNAEGTLVIPTVYAMCGSIAPGADPSGEESTDPTLPVWGQMQGMIGNLAELATTSKDNLVAAINEAAQSGGGGGSAIALDTTLTQSGKAADAKAVGDALAGKQPKGDYLTQNELPDMTAYRTAEAQDAIDAGKQNTLIQSGAAVGQIAKITAVDENGKPTEWEAADMPSGGGGGGGTSEEFILLAEVTLEEDVKKVTLPLSSPTKHFITRMWCPKTSSTGNPTYLSIGINGGSGNLLYYLSGNIPSKDNRTQCTVEAHGLNDGNWAISAYTNTGDAEGALSNYNKNAMIPIGVRNNGIMQAESVVFDVITNDATQYFPVGSILKVWGV